MSGAMVLCKQVRTRTHILPRTTSKRMDGPLTAAAFLRKEAFFRSSVKELIPYSQINLTSRPQFLVALV